MCGTSVQFLQPIIVMVAADFLISIAGSVYMWSTFASRALSSISVPMVAVRSMSRDLDKDIQCMMATNARL